MRRCGRNIAAYLLFAAGIAMVLYGMWHGEPGIVLNKAIRICLECIGIG